MPAANYVTEYGAVSASLEEELKGSDWNEIQDRTEIIVAASEDEGGYPDPKWDDASGQTGFVGGTWLYGEMTINNNTTKVIDNSSAFLNCFADMYVVTVANANELPSGVNHDPTNNILGAGHAFWNTKSGASALGGFGAADNAWNHSGDLWLFADDANAGLSARNDGAGGAILFYWMILMTGPTEY
jgi:hypothetical protein